MHPNVNEKPIIYALGQYAKQREQWVSSPGLLTWRTQQECTYLRVSIAVKRHHDYSNSYKMKHVTVVAHLQFRGLVQYHHGRKQGSKQTDMVLER